MKHKKKHIKQTEKRNGSQEETITEIRKQKNILNDYKTSNNKKKNGNKLKNRKRKMENNKKTVNKQK